MMFSIRNGYIVLWIVI